MKKILALVMALALVFSMGVSALADGHPLPTTSPLHGSDSSALVSTQKSKLDTSTATPVGAENNKLTTDFYLNIDRDATSTTGPTNDITVYASDKSSNRYIIDYKKTVQTTLNLTVPMYVCMYGFGVDGKVVVPDGSNYQIANNSTSKKTTKVEKITRYYKTYDNLYELFPTDSETKGWTSDDDIVNAPANSKVFIHGNQVDISYLQKILATYGNGYAFYIRSEVQPKAGSSGAGTVPVSTADTEKKANGDSNDANYKINYVSVILKSRCRQFDGDNNYYAEGETFDSTSDIKLLRINISGHGTTDVEVGKPYPPEHTYSGTPATPDSGVVKGIDCYVTGVSVTTPEGWELLPASRVGTLTKAGELTMTINGLDLCTVARNGGSYDMSGENRRWYIEKTKTLNLNVTASMAGGSVNSDGDVRVLNASYTITPEAIDVAKVIGANGTDPKPGDTTTFIPTP